MTDIHTYTEKIKSFGIIGGGIAGLYSAFKLYKKFDKNINITIFERSNILGGRVHTIYRDDISYDAGAGRFNKNHKLLFKLIKELKLQDKIILLPNDKIFIKDNKIINFNIEKFINKIFDEEKKTTIKDLKSKTLLMFLHEIFIPSEIDDFIYAYGYNSEFEIENAYDSIQNLKNIGDYFIIRGGLSCIIKELTNVLIKKGLIIKLDNDVIDIDIKMNTLSSMYHQQKLDYHFDKLIFCITKNDLLNIPELINNDYKLNNTLNTVIARPLYRIYAKFPKEKNGKVWFYNMSRICTNNILRSIIPINKDYGLIMISYTDGMWADMWNYYKKNDLKNAIMKQLRILFPNLIISDLEWIDNFYWPYAVHYPIPYYQKYQNNNENYFICGEVMTDRCNGWIEGALISVERGLKKLIIKT